jgi:RNA-directed DNA polymerase
MGYHSIPTRRASLISATTGQVGLTIRRRMVPRSPSLALPTSGGKSRAGKNEVRQVTAKNRYARALAAVTEWCRSNRHQSIPHQRAHLTAMMRGHYAYYGITGNLRRIRWYADQAARIWQQWLSRRDRGNRLHWSRFTALLKRHPLPTARIVHRYTFASEALP